MNTCPSRRRFAGLILLTMLATGAHAAPCTLSTVTMVARQGDIVDREISLNLSGGEAIIEESSPASFERSVSLFTDQAGKVLGQSAETDAVAIGYRLKASCSGDQVQLQLTHVAQSGTASLPRALLDDPSHPPLTERFHVSFVLFGRPDADVARYVQRDWSYTLTAR